MHLATYLRLLETGAQTLATSYRQVGGGHDQEPDVLTMCSAFAAQCEQQHGRLAPVIDHYGEHPAGEPERLHAEGLSAARSGGLGLVRDLHDLYLLATYVDVAWTVVGQAGKGARDRDLVDLHDECAAQISGQLAWLSTRIKAAAPQALLVAD